MAQQKTSTVSIADELIAARAYERWIGRGCPVSDGTEDWFAARNELEVERRQKPAARMTSRKSAAKTLRA